jgi:ribosome-binding protein aMBF1 (putative translation factor)
MGRASRQGGGQNVRMAFDNEAAYVAAYCARVRALREARGWTQEQMADALGIPADRYRKYEGRSPLPSYLVERFAGIVGRDVEYVITGKSSGRRRGPRGGAPKQTTDDQPDA